MGNIEVHYEVATAPDGTIKDKKNRSVETALESSGSIGEGLAA